MGWWWKTPKPKAPPQESPVTPVTRPVQPNPLDSSRWWKKRTPEEPPPAVPSPAAPAPAYSEPPVSAPPLSEPVAEREPALKTPEDVVRHLLEEFPEGRNSVLLFCDPEPSGAAAPAIAALAAALSPQVAGQVLAVDEHSPDSKLSALFSAESGADIQSRAAAWNRLRQQYRFVLIGTSLAGSSTALAIARWADATYLLVRPGQTGQRAARRALDAIHRGGGRVLGCLLVTGR